MSQKAWILQYAECQTDSGDDDEEYVHDRREEICADDRREEICASQRDDVDDRPEPVSGMSHISDVENMSLSSCYLI